MKRLSLKKQFVDEKELKRKFAEESDATIFIDEHFELVDEDSGEVVALCLPMDCELESSTLRKALLSIKNWPTDSRGSGLLTTAKVFGYQPRAPIRQRPYCHKAVLRREQPDVHSKICDFALAAEEIFTRHLPEQALKQKKLLVEKVKPSWRMNGTMYTSGICNNNNALAYHRDRGNFEDFWSAMAIFKNGVEGGNLVVADYGVKINFPDKSIFYFNGMRWWHGVTPIKLMGKDSYRYTVVYYALKEMWKCLTVEDELNYAIKTREKIEQKRLYQSKGVK